MFIYVVKDILIKGDGPPCEVATYWQSPLAANREAEKLMLKYAPLNRWEQRSIDHRGWEYGKNCWLFSPTTRCIRVQRVEVR